MRPSERSKRLDGIVRFAMTDATEHDLLRARLLRGIERTPIGDKRECLASLRLSEWSSEFERLMRNRLLMGRFRYGRMDRSDQRNYDRIGSAMKRLRLYQASGNLEYLVDVANLCLMEFEHGSHPDKHFHAADDGEHVQQI